MPNGLAEAPPAVLWAAPGSATALWAAPGSETVPWMAAIPPIMGPGGGAKLDELAEVMLKILGSLIRFCSRLFSLLVGGLVGISRD